MKAVAFAVIVFFVCIARIAVATEDFIVEVEQNKVSIKATDVSLKALLFKLGEKADIAVRFTSDVDEKITISLREVSIKDAITKITPDNLSVFHNRGSDEKLKELIVIPKEELAETDTSELSRFLPTGETDDTDNRNPPVKVTSETKGTQQEDNLRGTVEVTGEVMKPGKYRIRRQMTVDDAIAAAGGRTSRASRKRVYQVFPAGDGTKRIVDPNELVDRDATLFIDEGFF